MQQVLLVIYDDECEIIHGEYCDLQTNDRKELVKNFLSTLDNFQHVGFTSDEQTIDRTVISELSCLRDFVNRRSTERTNIINNEPQELDNFIAKYTEQTDTLFQYNHQSFHEITDNYTTLKNFNPAEMYNLKEITGILQRISNVLTYEDQVFFHNSI